MQLKNIVDFEIWKEARHLTREIYTISKAPQFSKDYGLRDQMRRAAVSIMSNIADGFVLIILKSLSVMIKHLMITSNEVIGVVRNTAIQILRVIRKRFKHLERLERLELGPLTRVTHRNVSTTMLYAHVLNRGGRGVRSPGDSLATGLDR